MTLIMDSIERLNSIVVFLTDALASRTIGLESVQ